MPQKQSRIHKALDTAEQLYRESGLAWSLADVARQSGVSRGTLYRRFGSKQGLLEALQKEREIAIDPRQLKPPRERILDALVEVSRGVGLAKATLEAISQVAQVGEATIYRYFGSRKGLLTAYADERTPRTVLQQLPLDGSADVSSALQQLIRMALLTWQDHGPFLLAGVTASDEEQEIVKHLLALEAQARKQLTLYFDSLVQRGTLEGDPELLTGALVGMIAGIAITQKPHLSGDIDRTAQILTHLFLEGCHAQETTTHSDLARTEPQQKDTTR
ncbi:MAG: TetR/AcrR family transcriptional regulator [Deltaproteobacteria bacterium]|nr:MAG: TetR/AcrR family transcriptional regulator [Deltaproteobacteria bacterium]